MSLDLPLVVVRGGGDIATGVIHRLHKAGFPVVVLELPEPRVVRLPVSAAEAVYSGRHVVEGIVFEKIAQDRVRNAVLSKRWVPVLVDPEAVSLSELRPSVLIDARLRKRNLDSNTEMAPLVVGLGPGFVAGENCHAVVETKRGHTLGRVIWRLGEAAELDTGVPEPVAGFAAERVLHSPCDGVLYSKAKIGDLLRAGEFIATIHNQSVAAPFSGMLRGLIHDGVTVKANEKIGDLDPRSVYNHCFTISDKALAIGGAVLEAVFYWLQE